LYRSLNKKSNLNFLLNLNLNLSLLLLNLGSEFLSAVGTEEVLFPYDSRFLLSPFLAVHHPGREGHQDDDHEGVGHIGKQHKQNIETHQQEGRKEDDQKGVIPGGMAVLLKGKGPIGMAVGAGEFRSVHKRLIIPYIFSMLRIRLRLNVKMDGRSNPISGTACEAIFSNIEKWWNAPKNESIFG
jgi:hypothetical protein